MTVSADYLTFLSERLGPLGAITVRRMFGGAGLYCDGLIFAIVDDDVLFLKADEQTRPGFEAEGLAPFSYETSKGRQGVMSYYEAPAAALDDDQVLLDWAQRAMGAALRAAKDKKKKKSGRRS